MATKKAKTKAKPAAKSARAVPAKAGKKTAPKAAKKAAPKRATKAKVPPIPKGYHSLTPYLIVRDTAAAMDFYAKAFGAKETLRMSMPDGTVMHAEIKIGDSPLMLSEENPQWGTKSPLTLGGNATHVMIYTKDADAAFARALLALLGHLLHPRIRAGSRRAGTFCHVGQCHRRDLEGCLQGLW